MRIAVDKTDTSARGTSSRAAGGAAPALSPPVAQGAALPQAQPPADLLALQQVIASRPPPPPIVPVATATPPVQARGETPAAERAPTVGALVAELGGIVTQTHARQLSQIARALSGVTITDGDVDGVLRILQTVEGPVINALMRAIPAKRLAEYVDNLNSPHAKRFRREVLESLWVAAPDMLRELDTDVIEDMNVRSLGVREHRALIYVLRNVGPRHLRHILDSDNGKNIRPLLDGGLPVYTEDEQRKDLNRALATERGEQQEAAADRVRLAAVETTLDQRFKVLTDFIVTDAEATRVFDWIAGFYPDEAMIGALTRKLEAMGRLDRLLDELPEKVAFDRSNPAVRRAATWLTILRYRPAEKNLALAEKLLSRGVFDWAVTDAEARLAYHLIKAMPLALQARFRELDQGKWLLRLEQELGAEVIKSGEYQGVEVTAKVVGGEEVLEDTAAKLAAQYERQGVRDRLARLTATLEQGIDAAQAQAIFQELGDIADPQEAWAVIRRLDSLGHVETLLARLGNDYLFQDVQERGAGRLKPRFRRESTLRLFLGRDPVHLAAHARALLRWPVSRTEAFLAYHLVKALPEGQKQEFLEADDGNWWAKIKSNLTLDQIEAAGTNPYTGGQDNEDRIRIRLQLADASLWSPEKAELLDGLVRMGQAAGDGAWIFEQSRSHPPDPRQIALYRKHRLFIAGEITAYEPEQIRDTGKGFHFWQLLDFLIGGYKDLDLDDIGGIEGLDLIELQQALGAVGGITFKTQDEVEAGQPNPPVRAADPVVEKYLQDLRRQKGKVNVVDARWDLARGSVRADAPDLQFKRADILLGSLKATTAAGALQGLSLFAHYPTPADRSAPFVRLDFSKIVLHDLLLVESSAMQAVKDVEAGPVAAQISRPGATLAGQQPLGTPSESGFVPILMVMAAVSPGTAGLFLLQRLVYLLLQALKLGDQLDEVMKGFERRTTPLGVQLDIADLQIHGITSSHGQSIRTLTVSKLSIAGGQSKSALIHATIQYLTRRAALYQQAGAADQAEQLSRQRTALEAQLPGVIDQEQQLAALQDRYRVDPASFTAKDQERLDALQGELGGQGGGFLSIGEIKLEGLEGLVSGSLTLKDLFGMGEGPALGHALTTLDAFIRRGPELGPNDRQALAAQGLDPKLTARERREKKTTDRGVAAMLAAANAGLASDLWLGDLELSSFRVAGSIPDAEDLTARIAEIKARDELWFLDDKKRASLQEIEQQIADVKEYHALADRLITLTPPERQRLDALLTTFRERTAFEAQRLALQGTSLRVTARTGESGLASASVALHADRIEGERVRVAGQEIRRVTGRDVTVDAGLQGGLLAVLDPLRALRSAGLSAGHLDVDTGPRRFLADDLRVTADLGKPASTDPRAKGDAAVRVSARKLVVQGVDRETALRFMRGQYEALKNQKKRKPPEEKRRQELEKRLDEVKQLQAAVITASDAYVHATDPADRQTKRQALQAAEDALDHWAQGLGKITASDLDVALGGLGDVTGDDFDPGALLEKGITLAPGKKGGKLVGSVLAEGEIIPGAGIAQLEGVAGQVFFSDKRIDFTGLTIDDFYGEGITFADGKNEARTRGRTGFAGLTLSGSIQLRERLNDDLEWTRTLDELHIRSFELKALYASGIDVRTPDFSLDLPEGYLTGIHADDFKVKPASGLLPDDSATVTGHLGLDALRVQRLGLLVGKTLQAGGTFRGRGLSIDLVSARRRIIRLADLDATSAKVLLPGSGIRVHFNAHHLGVDVEQDGDRILIHRVSLGDLTLASSYISAAGIVLDVRKQAAMHGVHVSAEVTTYQKKNGSLGAGRILLTELVIGELDADDLHVHLDGKEEVKKADQVVQEASDPIDIDLSRGVIRDLQITRLDTAALTGDLRTGEVDLQNLHVLVGKEAARTLELNKGFIKGQHLGATLHKGGGITLRLGDLEKLSGTLTVGGVTTDLEGTSVRGEIEKQGDQLSFTGLGLGALKVSKLSFTDVAKKLSMEQTATMTGFTLDKLVLVLEDAPLQSDARPGAKPDRRVKSLTITGLRIPSIEAPELTYRGYSENKPGEGPDKWVEIGFKSAALKALRVSSLKYERGGDARIDAGLDRLDVNRLKVNLDDALDTAAKGHGTTPGFLHLLTDAHVGAVTADVTAKEFLKDGKLGQLTGTARIGLFGLDNVTLDADGGIHVTAGKLETHARADFDPKKGIQISIGTTTVRDVVFTQGANEVTVGQLTVPPTALSVNNDTDLEDITIDGPIRIDGKTAGGKALPAITYTDQESGLTVTVKEGLAYGLKVTLKNSKFELLEIGRVVVTQGAFDLPDKPDKPETPTSPMTHFISSFHALDTAHGKVDIALDQGILNTDVTTYKFTVEGGRITHKEIWHRDNSGEKQIEEKDYDKYSLVGATSFSTLAELIQLVVLILNARQVAKQEAEKQNEEPEKPEKKDGVTAGDVAKFIAQGYLMSTTVDMKLTIDPGGVVPFKDGKGRTIGLLRIGGAKDIDNTLTIQGSPGKQLNIDLPSLVLGSIRWELSTVNLFLEQIKLTGSSIQLRTFPALTLSGKIDSAELTKLQVGKPSRVAGPAQPDDKDKAAPGPK